MVLLRLETSEWTFLNDSGEVVESAPAESAKLFVAARPTSDGWVVSKVSVPDEQEWATMLSLMEE